MAETKGKKEDDEEEDIEPEEEDDSDVDVKDDYEKPEEEDDVILDADLDGPPVLDLEGGGIPLDEDDDEINLNNNVKFNLKNDFQNIMNYDKKLKLKHEVIRILVNHHISDNDIKHL